jgi:hypothetical protein
MGNSISLYSNIQRGGQDRDGNGDDKSPEDHIVTLFDSLDFIATYYILTTDFTSLSQLHEKKYCEDLVVLTSDIIDKYFTDLEVEGLAQRVESGADESKKLVFYKKSDIDKLNIPDAETKKKYCNDIAKFYIKIAHIFAAIVTTINPVYTYKNMFGVTVKRTLMQKSSIPSGVDVTVSKINLCSEKIDALQGKNPINLDDIDIEEDMDATAAEEDEPEAENPVVEEEEPLIAESEQSKREDPTVEEIHSQDGGQKKISIHPEICSVNLDKNDETNYLDEEPGIHELIDLYFDGEYDYKTGKFLGMTPETEKQFQQDLQSFYLTFTDEKEMPADIKKFSDIKMRDYSAKKICKTPQKTYTGTYKDKLFYEYALNLKNMIQSVNQKQNKLLEIINKLFTYAVDPVTKKDVIRINPKLTEHELQDIVVETRNLIIELYLKCETDFVEGVKIYEAIVESQIFETTQKHIEQLEKEKEKLIAPSKPEPPKETDDETKETDAETKETDAETKETDAEAKHAETKETDAEAKDAETKETDAETQDAETKETDAETKDETKDAETKEEKIKEQ